ncbi:MAG: hypothetical protein CM15mP103_07740 [Gammaproteobacteria bacterium]|nr:MAG: hypothetical protein CM15mP103_07740 [Gammaproteobacteria bacterium]
MRLVHPCKAGRCDCHCAALGPPDQRALSARETAERFSDLVGDIPDADEVTVNYTLGDSEASITFLLQHEDLDTLNAASRTLQQHLAGYDKAYFVRDDQWGELPELRFHCSGCRASGHHVGRRIHPSASGVLRRGGAALPGRTATSG